MEEYGHSLIYAQWDGFRGPSQLQQDYIALSLFLLCSLFQGF